MVKLNGTIEHSRLYPSPNPTVRLQEITYWSDGLKVKGLLAEPIKEGQYEGIIYLRGGMQHIGMVRPARIAQFASEGFIVFAPYYRGNRGGEGRDEFAGGDRMDAVYAVDVLKQHVEIKDDRIHLFAFSRGGLMALWTSVLRDDVTSVVTWAGVSDIMSTYYERKDMRKMMKRVIGGTPDRKVDGYRMRNALERIGDINVPMLIIHGMLDEHVSFKQAKTLEDALMKNKKQVQTWYYPAFTHYFPPQENRAIVAQLCRWMREQ